MVWPLFGHLPATMGQRFAGSLSRELAAASDKATPYSAQLVENQTLQSWFLAPVPARSPRHTGTLGKQARGSAGRWSSAVRVILGYLASCRAEG